jgi:hypothetical protein
MRLYVAGAIRPGGGNLAIKPRLPSRLTALNLNSIGKHANDRGAHRPREQIKKKEEFPGFMGNMAPGNSFPQICVVSVSENALITK